MSMWPPREAHSARRMSGLPSHPWTISELECHIERGSAEEWHRRSNGKADILQKLGPGRPAFQACRRRKEGRGSLVVDATGQTRLMVNFLPLMCSRTWDWITDILCWMSLIARPPLDVCTNTKHDCGGSIGTNRGSSWFTCDSKRRIRLLFAIDKGVGCWIVIARDPGWAGLRRENNAGAAIGILSQHSRGLIARVTLELDSHRAPSGSDRNFG
ncbi:uncharacterized protein BJX67DRAFT_276989 [Aspergillus lucknowensis]|uniref:Uncharacterized protein n=1 Tax=Aspergillus lucknowensis TaxID=176173 RepID=A0ABR4M060_9EURO